ncbi:hypothetical protein QYF61_014920 [Mycteria americana]|uniref:Rna-directed dna polymerase from mobile element jockey-like n=1 Tax=Mycteria americana TaxID=33587 RepID=A0AAN7S879_MYCAM|nr:hypothetical protein QYF61_014920 [Mycteria americana]
MEKATLEQVHLKVTVAVDKPMPQQPKPTPRPLPVRAQSGKEGGSPQWRDNRSEKLDVFRSIGLDGNHLKLLEDLVGLSMRPLSIFIFEKGKEEDLGNYTPVIFTSVNGKIREHIISSSQPRKANHGRFLGTGKPPKVTALFKKGKKEDPRIYRAGGLTSVPGKVVLQMISKPFKDKKAQRVVISGIRSSWRPVTSGVPQELILLDIFINDLGDETECTLSKFADDTNLGGVGDTSDGCAAIQRDLDSLEKWVNRIFMKFEKGNAKSCTWGENVKYLRIQYLIQQYSKSWCCLNHQ